MKRLVRLLAAAALLPLSAGASPLQQRVPATTAAPALRLVLLGTAGGPPAHAARSQPANLLRVNGKNYVIDAGENVAQQMTKAGVPASAVEATFITHMHWDHVLGLGYFMATGWMLGRTAPMPVFGPPGLADYLTREEAALGIGETIFRAQSPERPTLASLYPARVIDIATPTEVFRDARVRVTAVPNSHFAVVHGAPARYGADKSYSYRFDTAGGSVVFTGDTGPSDAVTHLARGADILVSEICDVDSIRAAMLAINPAGNYDKLITHMREQHLSAEDVGRMAAAAGVKTLVLSHYVMGQRYDPEGFVAKIRPFFGGKIVVGQDLLVVDAPAR